jgi:hypothetical protein
MQSAGKRAGFSRLSAGRPIRARSVYPNCVALARALGGESGKEKPGHRDRVRVNQFCGRGTTSTASDQYLAITGAGVPQLKW